MREKLIELVNDVLGYLPWGQISSHTAAELADYLIANGVTVQELDGCEYCKEDSEGYRTMFGAFSITNPFHCNEWFINTGHCKPRKIYFCPMCGRKLPPDLKKGAQNE